MQLILTENSFKFTDKHYLQTHGVVMGSKMAVAFSVIFVAHVEKKLINASPANHLTGRDLFMTCSQYGLFLKPISTILLISPRTLSTQQ